jgi:hypothetical protein
MLFNGLFAFVILFYHDICDSHRNVLFLHNKYDIHEILTLFLPIKECARTFTRAAMLVISTILKEGTCSVFHQERSVIRFVVHHTNDHSTFPSKYILRKIAIIPFHIFFFLLTQPSTPTFSLPFLLPPPRRPLPSLTAAAPPCPPASWGFLPDPQHHWCPPQSPDNRPKSNIPYRIEG